MEKNRANLTLKRLESTFKISEYNDIVDILKHHVGERHVFVTSLISHYCGVSINWSIRNNVS